MFLEIVVRNDICLDLAVHYLSHSGIYKTVYLLCGDVLFVSYFLGDKAEGYIVLLSFSIVLLLFFAGH